MSRFDACRNAYSNARRTCSPAGVLEEVAQLSLASRYTRIALPQKLRLIVDEGVCYGLAPEGISAAELARTMNQSA